MQRTIIAMIITAKMSEMNHLTREQAQQKMLSMQSQRQQPILDF